MQFNWSSRIERYNWYDKSKNLTLIYLDKYRWLKFAIVGGSGIIVNLSIIWFLTDICNIHYTVSGTAAFVISTTNNYIWNYKWTFNDKQVSWFTGWGKYLIMAFAMWLTYTGLIVIFTEYAHIWYVVSALIAIFTTFIGRYIIANEYIWKEVK